MAMALVQETELDELSSVMVGRQRLTFERQLDFVLQWWQEMHSLQVCRALELLVRHCQNKEMRFLSTVLEPTYHRDFLYSAQRRHPEREFLPVSTPATRKVRSRLQNSLRPEHRLLYRPQSMVFTSVEDVRQLTLRHRSPSPSAFCQSPEDKQLSPSQAQSAVGFKNVTHTERRAASSLLVERPRMSCLSVDGFSPRRNVQSAPPYRRHSASPVRRHMFSPDFNVTSVTAEFSVIRQTIQWFTSRWTDNERLIALREILLLLDEHQLYYLSGIIAVTQRHDLVSQLPEDIAVKVMCFLPPKDLVAVQKVSRKWYPLGSNEDVWQQKCREIILSVPIGKFNSWKELFRCNAITQANCRKGKCRVKKVMGHTDGILCCKVDGLRLVTGSLDKTIKVWDVTSGKHVSTLVGHLRGVWSVAFLNQTLLVSASHDHTIKIWNLRTSTCERTVMGHGGPVWSVAVKKNILVSGSQDKAVCIWDLRSCSCVWMLTDHGGPVFCVDINEDASQAFSGSGDKTIRMWDIKKGYCVRVLKASSTFSVMSINYSKSMLSSDFSGSHGRRQRHSS